jgi:IS605 OrfB family transposase
MTLQIQLFPDKEQAAQMKAAIERFNEAANWLARHAFERKTANKFHLQKLYYAELRERFGLPAQMAIRSIAQVCEAYKRDKSKRPKFRKDAALPLDHHLMGFKGVDRVSIKTLSARVVLPFVMGAYQRERFGFAKGQADLVRRKDGKWFLLVTVDLPEGTPIPSTDWIGIDLGVINLATDSDGEHYSGEQVERVRQKYQEQRRKLQKAASASEKRGKRPKNIRRKLQKISRKESRFRRNENHTISKRLVVKAKDTKRGLVFEDLEGINSRIRFRKAQRAKMSGWAFRQLRTFAEYKALREGIPTILVDPRNSSRECSECGYTDKANRPKQAIFECKQCGFHTHADFNAARNLRARAAVIRPMVAEHSRKTATLVQRQAAGF